MNQFSETQVLPLRTSGDTGRVARGNRWTVYCAPNDHRMSTIPKSPNVQQVQQRQLISRFIQGFCPSMDPTLRPCERIHHYWVHCLPNIHGRAPVLDAAIMALCAGFLGRVMNDEPLQQRAMTMTGEALRELSTIIAVPNLCASDNVLAAVMCMGMAEVRKIPGASQISSELTTAQKVYSVPTQPAVDVGWASHNKGGCELLVSRGPSILRSELARGLLLRFRVTGVWTQLVYEASVLLKSGNKLYAAIGRRKPFPFANPELRQISKEANQNYYDNLMDAMVDIPGLLHDLNNMRQADAGKRRELKKGIEGILMRGKTIGVELGTWLADFVMENISAWHCVIGPPRPSSSTFPGTFRFQNLLAAQAMVHFWAGLVILARCYAMCQDMGTGITNLEKEVHEACIELFKCSPLHASSEGTPISMVWDPQALGLHFADMICSAAGYFISGDRGISGPMILLFPLWIAKDMYANVMDDLSRHKEVFCIHIFRTLASRGMKISDALVSLSTKTP